MKETRNILLKSAIIMLVTVGVVVIIQTIMEWRNGRDSLLLFSAIKVATLAIASGSVFYAASRRKPIISMAILTGIAIIIFVIFAVARIQFLSSEHHSLSVLIISRIGDMIVGVVATMKGLDYGEYRKRDISIYQ